MTTHRPSSPPTSPDDSFHSTKTRPAMALNKRQAGMFQFSHSPPSDDPGSLPRHVSLWGSTQGPGSTHRSPSQMSISGSEAEDEDISDSDEDNSEDVEDISDSYVSDSGEALDEDLIHEEPLTIRDAIPEIDEHLSDSSTSSRDFQPSIHVFADGKQRFATFTVEEVHTATNIADAEVVHPDISDAETDLNSNQDRKRRESREFCSKFSGLQCHEEHSDDSTDGEDTEIQRRRLERQKRWSQRSSYQKRTYTESLGSSGSDRASCEIDRDMVDGQGISRSERRLRRRIRGPGDTSRFSLNSVDEEVFNFFQQGALLAEEPDEWDLNTDCPSGYMGVERIADSMDRAWQELPFWRVDPMVIDDLET